MNSFLVYKIRSWFRLPITRLPFRVLVMKAWTETIHYCSCSEVFTCNHLQTLKKQRKLSFHMQLHLSKEGSRMEYLLVNLCQKLLFLHQLTHNLTTDCLWIVHGITMSNLLSYCGLVSWYKNRCFWKRFTYTIAVR